MRGPCIAVALIVCAAPARADDSHYQNLLAGERAQGFAGAYAAIASDPSANYYNPAGLVDVKGSILSASLSLYGLQTGAISQAFSGPGNGVAGLASSVASVASQVVPVPGMAGSVNGFGKKDEKGRFRHAWSLSVLVLDDEATTVSQTTFNQGSLSDISQNQSDESTWLATGYAYRLNSQVSLGISANAVYRSFKQQARLINGSGPTSQGGFSSFTLSESLVALQVVALFANAGVLYKPDDRWSFGLSLATPSVTVYGSGQSNTVNASNQGLGDSPSGTLAADSPVPFHGRAGAAVRIGPATTLAGDVSFWAPVSYPLLGGAAAANLATPNLVTQVTRRAVVNGSLGAEGLLAPRYALRGGLFTNFSSAPAIDDGSEPQLPDVNTYGAAISMTLPSSHNTETTLGAVYDFGLGKAKLPDGTVTTATISNFAITVGGSYEF